MRIINVIDNIIGVIKCLLHINNKLAIIRYDIIKPIIYTCRKIIMIKTINFQLAYCIFETFIIILNVANIPFNYSIKNDKNNDTNNNKKNELINHILKFTIQLCIVFSKSAMSYIIYVKNYIIN
jgi:hypothetical protein